MDDNNSSRMILDKKMDELALSVSSFHALISRNDMLSANPSLQKSLSDLHLMLKKVDSAFMGYNGDRVKNDNPEHCDAKSESLSDPNPSSLFPSSPFNPYSPVKLENKIGEYVDLNNDLEGVDNKKNGGETSNAQNYKNSSVPELETLEDEILVALQRLEKTKSNLELEKEK
jgi:hypothetical protein